MNDEWDPFNMEELMVTEATRAGVGVALPAGRVLRRTFPVVVAPPEDTNPTTPPFPNGNYENASDYLKRKGR